MKFVLKETQTDVKEWNHITDPSQDPSNIVGVHRGPREQGHDGEVEASNDQGIPERLEDAGQQGTHNHTMEYAQNYESQINEEGREGRILETYDIVQGNKVTKAHKNPKWKLNRQQAQIMRN